MVDEEYDVKTLEVLEEERKKKEARSRAEVLEMIGDIQSADLKPPENVSSIQKNFVTKLIQRHQTKNNHPQTVPLIDARSS